MISKKRTYCLGFCICLIAFSAYADRITSAYKQIQKGDFPRAKDLLLKELEKDSLSAGAFHIFSLYYFSENNESYDIDSAYFFVKEAIHYYPQIESKDSSNWAKEGITQESARTLKSNIEAKAFDNASKENTVASFQSFMDRFPSAQELPAAVESRNALAWQEAQSQNTLMAYQNFMDTYPEAEQFSEALKKRDQFVYERETSTNTLSNLQRFIQDFPQNTYLGDAIDRLFKLSSIDHSLETYKTFIQKYPQAKTSAQAWDWLLALYKEDKDLISFKTDFPNYYRPDYLSQLTEVDEMQYVPIYNEGRLYGFIDEKGKVRIDPQFEFINPDYLCESMEEDFIVTNVNGRLGLIDKLGKVIIKPQFDKIEKLAPGLFLVTKNAFLGVIHYTGREILALEFDGIEVLNEHFLKIRKNRRWGLAGHNGMIIVEPTFTAIEPLGESYISFSKRNQYAISTTQDLIELGQEQDLEIAPTHQSVSLFDDQYALLEQGGKYGLRNLSGDYIFRIDKKEIREIPQRGWATFQDSTWQIHNMSGQAISNIRFTKYLLSDDLIIGKVNDQWGLINFKGDTLLNFESDSLAMLGNIILQYKGRKVTGVFPKDPAMPVQDLTYFRSLRAEKGNYTDASIFLYYEDRYGKKGLFSPMGKKILSPKYSNLYILDEDLVNVQLYGKYGLVDSLRKLVLPIRYQGITNMQEDNNYKVLLLNRKFGLYSKVYKVNISPAFDEQPRLFRAETDSTHLILAKKRGKYGLINQKNKAIIPFKFSAIEPWQDSIALVQLEDETWAFYNFASSAEEKLSEERLDDIQYIQKGSKFSLIQYQMSNTYGLWSSQKGRLSNSEFNHITNLGSPQNPIFFAEKRSEDNTRYEVTYINQEGQIIWQRQMSDQEYYKLVCE